MPKTEVTKKYVDALNEFVGLLNDTFASENAGFHYESGRLYDKVMVTDASGVSKVRFFVEREVGTIYGKKSELAPNLKWFFGDLYTTDEWLGDREYPEPKNPDNFQKVSEYGKYKHYQPLTSATADT